MKAAMLLCALAAPTVAAAEDVGKWYLTPQVGGISVDNDRLLQDKDWLYGVSLGKHVNQGLSVELNLNGAQIGGGPGRSDLSLYGASFDLLRVMNRSGRFAPYISAGLGTVQNERSPGSNATDFMVQAGVGAMLKVWESADDSSSFALRPEIKARWDEAGAEGMMADYIGTLGFQYSFGRPVQVAAAPAAPVAAPAPEPTPPPPPPPPPPGDADKDGVTDDLDKCPDTPAGVAVDASGCPRKGSITLEGVAFEVNSARLTADSRAVLEGVGADLKKYPRLRIELQGHTDSSGSDQYNLKLSQQRAEAVRTHLVEQGVPEAQLVARGYGEAQPIDNNATAEGREKNRRVVMFVVDNPAEVKVQGEGTVTP